MISEYDTALGTKIEKCVAVQVNFTDTLYIEQTGLQSVEIERVKSVSCQTPVLYLQATIVSTHGSALKSIIDFILNYLLFCVSTVYKKKPFQVFASSFC